MSDDIKAEDDREQVQRRDEALRRALAMPPLAKAKRRQDSVKQALTDIIQEARDVRAEIASLREDRDARSDP
jgi:hypothetical protein